MTFKLMVVPCLTGTTLGEIRLNATPCYAVVTEFGRYQSVTCRHTTCICTNVFCDKESYIAHHITIA